MYCCPSSNTGIIDINVSIFRKNPRKERNLKEMRQIYCIITNMSKQVSSNQEFRIFIFSFADGGTEQEKGHI